MHTFQLLRFRIKHFLSPSYQCPICNYHGPFQTAWPGKPTQRRYAICPQCGASERQRMQWAIVNELSLSHHFKEKKLLHFAPEPVLLTKFQKLFADTTTIDLLMPKVDVHADICHLPFSDASFDVIFASHVLEHVKADLQAMSEIRRVLKPDGLAVIEVPITSISAIEYKEPNPYEFGHVRAPGGEYYDRFSIYFSKMRKITSDDMPAKYQTYYHCDWSMFPTAESPIREPMTGKNHPIHIAVYYK